MKFELDTNAKTVKLLEDATLGDVNAVLEKVLGDEARQYQIITNAAYYRPVIVSRPIEIWPTRRWWDSPIWVDYSTSGKFEITCSTSDASMNVAALQ
jgi:hypothetical protein